jgi:hypothetical protein
VKSRTTPPTVVSAAPLYSPAPVSPAHVTLVPLTDSNTAARRVDRELKCVRATPEYHSKRPFLPCFVQPGAE